MSLKLKKILLIILLIPLSLEATCTDLNDRYFYSGGLSKGESVCYSYRIESNRFPVFTLKQQTYSNADFDIHIYDYSNFTSLLAKGIKNNSNKELVTLKPTDSSNYVYIKIKNEGTSYGKYRFYANSINIGDKVAETLVLSTVQAGVELLLESFFDVKSSSDNSEKRNVSRGSTAIMAYLANKNFGDTSVDLMINEVTTSVQEAFGYGFLGKLLVNFSVGMVQEVYRYY